MLIKFKFLSTAFVATISVLASAAIAADSVGTSVVTDAPPLPDFLPRYFSPLLSIGGERLILKSHQTNNGTDLFTYEAPKQKVILTIESRACAGSVCEALFSNSLNNVNQIATKTAGKFIHLTGTEFDAVWSTGDTASMTFGFRVPNSVTYWTYNVQKGSELPPDNFDATRFLVNRQRYEEASSSDVVEMGRWDISFRQLAEQLLREGRTPEALEVLAAIIKSSPTDYEAQIDFANYTLNSKASRESAQAVFNDAESAEMRSRSAAILKVNDPSSSALQILKKGENGLQAILIALPPCDAKVLVDAARVYSDITKIPTKVVRLSEAWQFGKPDRIPNQREIQEFIVRHGGAVDFKGWSLENYKAELLRLTSVDAATEFNIESLVTGLNAESAQYSAEPYLNELAKILEGYQSKDARTVFVGVTSNNISFGDANFVFGAGAKTSAGFISLVSYHMMEAKYSSSQYESYKRLVERLAKELVPATLSALDIPRPADPLDPASYASGIDRLDQKGLVLSAPTRKAIDNLR